MGSGDGRSPRGNGERTARPKRRRPAGGAETQKPQLIELGFCMGRLAVSYFHMANATLSSALRRFTVLFGMGRRGTTSLWPPDINCTNLKKPEPVSQTDSHIFGI